jgi:hypothetical protein
MKRVILATIALLGLIQAYPANAADVRMYIRHDVADYVTWRKVYDGFDAERRGLGVIGHAVYRSVDNPNDVTVSRRAFSSAPSVIDITCATQDSNLDQGNAGAPVTGSKSISCCSPSNSSSSSGSVLRFHPSRG